MIQGVQLRRISDLDNLLSMSRTDFLKFTNALSLDELGYLLTGWVGCAELLRRYTREILS